MAHLFSFGNGIIELKIMAHRVVVVITPLALPPVQLLLAVASVPFPQDKCWRGHQDQTTTSGTHILLHDHIIRGGWIVIEILVAMIVVVMIRGQCLDDRSVVPHVLCCLLLVHVGRQHQLLIVMVIVELNRHFLLLVPIESSSSSCSACPCSFTHTMTIHPEIIIIITLLLLL